eukprot:CAMPEP_0176420222 /NCGR_PEP_ID=MMETSP0127-20121128/8487_1 /TAXON_ID=938130 /ORGANISM="Platyophrya macrostoma, Strain WH" /LENGTH=470 /DNA_ID=CAMNT_0017800795 /DNA_START=886 /DNA_END=2298 /DNA_ORIENTATION=-
MGTPIVFTYSGLLGLYQYLNVNYGSNAVLFFQKFFSLNDQSGSLNLFEPIETESESKYWKSDTRIQGDNKFHFFMISNLFLKNFGGKLSLILGILSVVPVLVLISMVIQHVGVNKKYLRVFEKLRTFIQWNLVFSVLLACLVPMVLSACIQINFYDQPKAWFDVVSTSVSIVAAIGAASLVVALYFLTRIDASNPSKSTEILTNQGTSPTAKNKYWALFSSLRSIFLVTLVSTLSNYPMVQCSAALGVNAVFFFGTLTWRFFDRLIKDIIIKTCEALHAIIPSLFLIHAVYELMGVKMSEQMRTFIGWGIIASVSAVTVLSLVFQALEMWYTIKSTVWNALKVFYHYSIGTDIWKRGPRPRNIPREEKEELNPKKVYNERNKEEARNMKDTNKEEARTVKDTSFGAYKNSIRRRYGEPESPEKLINPSTSRIHVEIEATGFNVVNSHREYLKQVRNKPFSSTLMSNRLDI